MKKSFETCFVTMPLEKITPCLHHNDQTKNNWYSPYILSFPLLYAILCALPYFSVWLAYTHILLRVSSTLSILCAILYVLELDAQLLRIMISKYMLTFIFTSATVLFYMLLWACIISLLHLHYWNKP